MTTTDRLNLPLIEPGQAQKELFHNEALLLLDAVVGASVVAVAVNVPPAAPEAGEAWIVGPAPVGAWQGRAGALASWTTGGWRFVRAREGLSVWCGTTKSAYRCVDGAWRAGAVSGERLTLGGQQVVGSRAAAIPDPRGGTVIDAESRATLAAVLAMMRDHGLIAR